MRARVCARVRAYVCVPLPPAVSRKGIESDPTIKRVHLVTGLVLAGKPCNTADPSLCKHRVASSVVQSDQPKFSE